MSSLFKVLGLLESNGVPFFLQRTRPDAITVTATFLEKRLEVYIFEDDHVEVSQFIGSEDIVGGEEVIQDAINHNG